MTQKTNRSARAIVALLVAGFVLMTASSAFALDRYASRKGVFAGLGFGGGVGAVDLTNPDESAGFEGGRQLGLHLNGMVGGGVNDQIVLGAQGNWWIRTVEKGSLELSHNHMNLLADANLFLIEGLYVDAGAGLAYTVYDAERAGSAIEHQEMGLAVKAGLGFEYFINGTHAVGINAGYTRHFYSQADFDTASAALSFRWY